MVSTENLGLIVRTSPIGQGLEQSSRLKSAWCLIVWCHFSITGWSERTDSKTLSELNSASVRSYYIGSSRSSCRVRLPKDLKRYGRSASDFILWNLLMGGPHVHTGYEWWGLYKGQITLIFGCIVLASFLVLVFFCKIENKSF